MQGLIKVMSKFKPHEEDMWSTGKLADANLLMASGYICKLPIGC